MTDVRDEAGFDAVNRPVWEATAGKHLIDGWSDPGEMAALLSVSSAVRGQPILDLGVGAGRTVPLLRLLSDDYTAIDYTPEMVDLCRNKHPRVDVRVGDARDLSEFDDRSQGFVMFSLNGLDALDHQDRQLVLAEISRVLRPGGIVMFSTLNKDGPLFGCNPSNAPGITWVPGSLLPVDPSDDSSSPEGRLARAIVNWRRLRIVAVDADGWGLAVFAAFEFSLLAHFATVPAQVAELRSHGFEVLSIFPCDKREPIPVDEPTDTLYFHVTATRI
ncbi:MAG: class I SAM-dependent methyltransferase [Actinomycetota bacterium]